MLEAAPTQQQAAHLVHPLEIAVNKMLGTLRDRPDVREELDENVRRKLADRGVRDEFVEWLKEAHIRPGPSLKWIASLKAGKIEDAIENGVAWDCVQVIVLAYLPGPRYFQGAYIKSALRDDASLDKMKNALQIPHLSGAVGWMSAHLLHRSPSDNYVALRDAQLDLRGRVAVSDLQLGNRSVAGFPVSMAFGNMDLSSISGFVFLSHPLAGVFPPSGTQGSPLSQALSESRRVHETALASAIESYLFRRYGRFVLRSRQEEQMDETVPLLTLSHDDPTGFLASILFESNPSGLLSADCDVNEDVFLEIAAWHLRVSNMYPDKWAPRFVQHMMRLGDLMERPSFASQVAMAWYPRSAEQTVGTLYPADVVSDLNTSLYQTGETMTWSAWNTGWDHEVTSRVGKALADILQVYGTPSEQIYQADLVAPAWYERDGNRHVLGFFRVNCDSRSVPHGTSVAPVFHNLWRALAESCRSIGPEIGRLLLGLEERYGFAGATKSAGLTPERKRAADIRHVKLWMDVSQLISDWLAQRMHQLVARLTHSVEVSDPDESLILFAMQASAVGGDTSLRQAFVVCSDKWKDLLAELPTQRFGDSFPEITLVSFWPRLKVPVILDISHLDGAKSDAEEEFASLLLADPGLLRMVGILAPILKPHELVKLSRTEEWGDVDFGAPTTRDIENLRIERSSGLTDLALDLRWSRKGEHSLRLTWEHSRNRRRLGSHAVSNVVGTVARHIGKNILDGVELALPPPNKAKVAQIDATQYHSLLEIVASPDGRALTDRLQRVERVMFYGTAEDTVGSWRILEVKSQPRAFLAALCDPQVERPIVLAFRDFALANAKAFYIAREFDSQRKAADEYARNLSAVAHGYKGPVLKLSAALEQAATDFRDDRDEVFVSDRMKDLQDMVKATRTLAEDAIFYAWRKNKARFKELECLGWKRLYDGQDGLEDGVGTVINALDLPHRKEICFDNQAFERDVVVYSSPFLWRHLLSKLVENGIEHTKDDAKATNSYKVFLRPFLRQTHLVLQIHNFVPPEDLSQVVARVRAGLQDGVPDTSRLNHGYGLIEAYNCCALLLVEPQISGDTKQSHLVIELPMLLKRA